jgi:general secretion pathway protein I
MNMRRTAGFTLVEVLVALAIVTIGMAALLAALGSSADSIAYQRDKTFAEWVALNRIEEVRLATQRPTKGKSEGTAEMAGQQWKWAQEVLETEVKGILRVDVSVRPASSPGGNDSGWFTTVSGIVGDALALPRGDMDPYGVPLQPGGPGGPGGAGGPGGENGPNNRNGNPPPNNPDNGSNPGDNDPPPANPPPDPNLPTD